MISNIEVLAIIPARGGSKGIPRKNIRLLSGVPLITWSIKTAQMCQHVDRLIVSTDDGEIAEIASRYGADVPFIQPAFLAQDDVPDFPVCKYALEWLETHQGYSPDVVVWLRPTAPLRRSLDVDQAVEKLIASKADCIRSISKVEHHPYWMKRLDGDCLIPFLEDGKDERAYPQRQLLPPVYRLNGAVDVTWAKNVTKHGYLFGGETLAHLMDLEFSLDIDSEIDFQIAELLLQRQQHATTDIDK